MPCRRIGRPLTIADTTSCPNGSNDGSNNVSKNQFGSDDDGTPATVLNHQVEVSTHEPGGVNTVSARFLSLLTGKPIGEYLAMVADAEEEAECFFKIEWVFPGFEALNGPKITTRHLLLTTESTSTPDLSFSGGLNWAKKLLEQVATSSSSSLQLNMQQQPGITAHVPRALASRVDDVKDQRSEASSESTTTKNETAEEFIEGYDHDTDANTPVPGSWNDKHQPAQHTTPSGLEMIIASLKEQRKEAEALYARNGDMSTMMALMERAKDIPDAWEPNGRARF
ncbi:hypothetical protein B0T20DRAFT_493110 [Sordaria brevicollis]|uniref:Uncharacterized protein n=1 Tax=Sordaria brevicollis TaxID=83679 RepID=A0AAE0PLC9_SORBR|nr:hypothetical protein B0T20DRAFT_493110 [Sordaria brevicollis]